MLHVRCLLSSHQDRFKSAENTLLSSTQSMLSCLEVTGQRLVINCCAPLYTCRCQVVQVVYGGLHIVVLTLSGHVLTWVFNDERAVGRPTDGLLWQAYAAAHLEDPRSIL